MSRHRSRNVIVGILAIVLVAWVFWPHTERNSSSLAGGDFQVLANRVWIDHIPKDERDKIDVFLLLDEPTVGIFSKSSAYEGDWAAFEWSLDKGLVLTMLQQQTTHRVKTKIASGAACAPFDHCLKLDGAPRGPKKYGSMEDWIINGQRDFDARQFISGILEVTN